MPQRIQTFLFDKAKFTVAQARKWLNDHKARSDKSDPATGDQQFHRFRQFEPSKCQAGSHKALTRFPSGIQAGSCNVAASESAEIAYTETEKAALIAEGFEIQEGEMKKSKRAFCGRVEAIESYDAEKGVARIRVIEAGKNKSGTREYPPAVLARDYTVFEGAKMFADHPSRSAARDRPERSIQDWVATAEHLEWDPTKEAVFADAAIIDPAFKAKMAELASHNKLSDMGVSIRAIGEGSEREEDGILVVERLIESLSVDFVTYPGAGGAVLALESEREEDRDLIGLIGEKRLRERRPDLVELIESSTRREEERMTKTIEELQAESRQKDEALEKETKAREAAEKERDAEKAKVAASEKAENVAKTKAAVEEALTNKDCKLPDATKGRIRKAFEGAESADGLKERIEEEQKYLKEVAAPSRPGGVGPSGGEKKPNLVESFQARGLTKEQAEVAARGRM